jgi:hypothetical protein
MTKSNLRNMPLPNKGSRNDPEHEDVDGLGDLPAESPVSYPGPFKHHDVVVNGHAVPFLRAKPKQDGGVSVQLDRRFGVDLSADEAERVIPFIAQCVAVALGQTCHPSPDVQEPPPRRAAAPVHSLSDSRVGAELA